MVQWLRIHLLLFLDLAKEEAPPWELTSAITGPKGSTQGAQEPGHLPEAVGQAVQVPGQTNQLHLQSGCPKETVHELHQPATTLPFLDDPENETS